jgi:hypothetical protein
VDEQFEEQPWGVPTVGNKDKKVYNRIGSLSTATKALDRLKMRQFRVFSPGWGGSS